MAEDERFELSKDIATLGHLANAWFQPLTHSSIPKNYLFLIYQVVKGYPDATWCKLYNTAYFIFLILIILSNSSSTEVPIVLKTGINFLLK